MPAQHVMMTVVEMIYHQPPDENPSAEEHRFDRQLQSNEQPYSRMFAVGEEWRLLDTGWVDDAALLSISNETGRFLQTLPTKEELEVLNAAVLEVSYDPDGVARGFLIPRGEAMRGSPTHLKDLYIRCRSGTAKCRVFIIPA